MKTGFQIFRIFMIFLVSIHLFTGGGNLFAQKVGLVLSGGGSRGAAHIGVIKALEENQIPIDYIVGNSIGAVVGGMYAAGYTTDQISALLKSDELKRWSAGEKNPDYYLYFKAEEPDPSWFNINFDFGRNLFYGLPTSLLSPDELDYALMEMFSGILTEKPYRFDNLMIPFRCVAADIENSTLEVFREGNLAQSIRASMTFPFYFKPIKINNKVYFDGGMYNNFPVDVLQDEFKPDIIIGSKVAGNYPSPEPDNLMSQLQRMLSAKTDYSVPAETGILITPSVDRVSVLDFNPVEAFIDSGYTAAYRKMDMIREKIERRISKNELDSERRKFLDRKKILIIDSVYFNGLDKAQRKYASKMMTRKRHNISAEDLRSDYFRLLTDENIRYIQPSLDYNDSTGYFDLRLDIRKNNPFSASFGGNISSRYTNQAFAELNYRYLFTHSLKSTANINFGRFYSSGFLGGKLEFPSRNPFAIDMAAVYNHWDYFRSATHFFDDKTPAYLIKSEVSGFLEGSSPISRLGKISTGMSLSAFTYNYHQNNAFTKSDTADRTLLDSYSTHIALDINNLNKKQYSNAGARLLIQLRHTGGTERFYPGSALGQLDNYKRHREWNQVRMVWDNYFKRLGPVVLGFYLDIFLSDQSLFGNYTSSLISAPAFSPVPETQTLFLPEYRAYSYAGSGLKLILKLGKRFDWRFEGYVFQPYQKIFRAENNTAYFGEVLSDRNFLGHSALVFHAPFGPVSFGINYFEDDGEQLQATLNIGFILFNRTAMD